ncbi:hypothetical protein ABEI22_00195 [Erwinia billingiae]|uniref:ApeA N-terminal domain 1-containing protein n=1 Tax=Erwinia billingiae TaxID=182337 RepID=UPI0032088BBD
MKGIDFYLDNVNENRKGLITIDNEDYAAELRITRSHIEVRFFDFSRKMKRDFSDLLSLETAVFYGGGEFFRLFGLELSESSFRLLGQVDSFNDYTFSAKGFLCSNNDLNYINTYQALSFYSKGISQWFGNTSKLNKIINESMINKMPEKEGLVEFKRTIKGVGEIGGYYSYKYGGLEGIHTVGMSVMPHVTLHFENEVDLNGLLDNYISLYMLMRLLIGTQLDFTTIKVHVSDKERNHGISLYLPEKSNTGRELHSSMSLPYSSPYHDESEKNFPLHIFDNYFSEERKETNLLIKKFINYSLIDSDEEKFLGFYRIVERATFKQSYYVDESELSALLDRSKVIIQKKLKCLSVSKFKRAVIRANRSKENTETCIRHYIKSMPLEFVIRMGLDKIKVDDLCKVRNNITHQPLFSVSAEKLHDCMVTSKILSIIILMCELEISYELIEEVANLNGWKEGVLHST